MPAQAAAGALPRPAPTLPISIPPELERLAADLPNDIFDETFSSACERLDRYIGALAVELAARLELTARPLPELAELFEARGWNEQGQLAIRWLIETLELYGLARRTATGWQVSPAPPTAAAALREEAERLLPATKPAYHVLELSASALPAILRGELRGEDALFGPTTLSLWFEYFSNTNPHYAPNNALTALAVARVAPQRAAIFEFGGGGGSAAEAVLGALAQSGKQPARYVFTEPQPAFLRRGTRLVQALLPAGCELLASRFDIDIDPESQGFACGEFDLVLGVNTLHLAHRLVPSLMGLRRLLRPGGALVFGELLRPSASAPVHLELPFTLLEKYRHAPLENGIRSRPGFISARGWLRALHEAGFRDVSVLPAEIERCAALYPGYYCGAITARN